MSLRSRIGRRLLTAALLFLGMKAQAIGMSSTGFNSPFFINDALGNTGTGAGFFLRGSGAYSAAGVPITTSITSSANILWPGYLLRVPTPTPTLTPSPSWTPTATPTATFTSTDTPSNTQTSSPSPSLTLTPSATLTVVVASTTPAGNGLCGFYYNDPGATHDKVNPPNGPMFVLARTDADVDFTTWAPDSSPWPGVNGDNWSACWTGTVLIPFSDYYTFYTDTDDGAQLFINGTKVIDKYNPQPLTEWAAAPVYLTAGAQVPITMDYFQQRINEVAVLEWSSTYISKQFIPQAYLYSPACALTPLPTSTLSASPTSSFSSSPTLSVTPSGTITLTPTPTPSPYAILALSQQSNVASVNNVPPGDQVQYVLSVANNGGAGANTVSVWDSLPANMTWLSSLSPGSSFNSGVVSFSSPLISASGSENFTLTLSYTGVQAPGSSITNLFSANASGLGEVDSSPLVIGVGEVFTATATPTQTPTITASDTATYSATPSVTTTSPASPTITPSDTSTYTISPTPSDVIPTATATETDSSTYSPTLTVTESDTPTFTETLTLTSTLTASPSFSASPSDTSTYSTTPSVSPTLSSSPSNTATPSATPSITETFSMTFTDTPSNSATITPTITDTLTITVSPTPTPSGTPSSTASATTTPTATLTATPQAPLLSLALQVSASAYLDQHLQNFLTLSNTSGSIEADSVFVYLSYSSQAQFIGPGVIEAPDYPNNDEWKETAFSGVYARGPFSLLPGSSQSLELDTNVQSISPNTLSLNAWLGAKALALGVSASASCNLLPGFAPTLTITPTFSDSPTPPGTYTATPTGTRTASPTPSYSVTVTPPGTLTSSPTPQPQPTFIVTMIVNTAPGLSYVGQNVSITVNISTTLNSPLARFVQLNVDRDAPTDSRSIAAPGFSIFEPPIGANALSLYAQNAWYLSTFNASPNSTWVTVYQELAGGQTASATFDYQVLLAAAGQNLTSSVQVLVNGVNTGVSDSASVVIPVSTPTSNITNTPTITPTPVAASGQIVAYPQPAHNQICFQYDAPLGNSGQLTIFVYNLAFQVVAKIQDQAQAGLVQNSCVDITGLAPGLYIYQASVGNFQFPPGQFGVTK